MKKLYLYPAEQKLFQALPEVFKKEFEILEEKLNFRDSPEKMSTRLSLARLHDPKLLALKSGLQNGGDFLTLLGNLSLKDVNESDLVELCFALGPVLLTSVVSVMLQGIETDAHMMSLSALVEVRHTLLSSLQQ